MPNDNKKKPQWADEAERARRRGNKRPVYKPPAWMNQGRANKKSDRQGPVTYRPRRTAAGGMTRVKSRDWYEWGDGQGGHKRYYEGDNVEMSWERALWAPWQRGTNATGRPNQARPSYPEAPPAGSGYWNDPQKVARYYHMLQVQDPQKTPDWLPADDIQAAYNYFRVTNKGRPWWEWKADPNIAPVLDQIQPPPDDMLWPDEKKGTFLYQPRASIEAGDYPSDYRGRFLGEGEKPPQYPGPIPMTKTDIPLDQFPAWQRFVMGALQSGGVAAGALQMGAFGGITGLLAGGPIGAVAGAFGGAILGAGIGGYAERHPELQDVLMKLDILAEWFERGASVPGLMYIAEKKAGKGATLADKSKALADVLVNIDSALKAGHMYYEVAGAGFGAEQGGVYDWDVPWTPQYVRKEMTGEEAFWKIYTDIRDGRNPDAVYAEWTERMGVSGYAREMIGHMLLDPANYAGAAGVPNYPLKKLGQITGNDALVQAAKMTHGPVEAMKTYQMFLRKGFLTGLSIDDIAQAGGIGGWLNRVLAGVTPEGKFNFAEAPPPPTFLGKTAGAAVTAIGGGIVGFGIGGPGGAIAGAALGAIPGYRSGIRYLFNMKPAARAVEMVNLFTLNSRAILNGADNVDDLVRMTNQLRNAPADLAKELSVTTLNSPEGSILPKMMEGYTAIDELKAKWDATAPLRENIEKIAKATGMTFDEVIQEIGKSEKNADGLLARIVDKAKQSDDPAAKAILDDYAQKKLTAKSIRDVFKAYVKEQIPWNFETFKDQAFASMMSHADDWASKWFDVKPDPAIVRLGHTVKSLQSLFLLGANPTYFINNAVNNIVTSAYQGVLGLRSPGNIEKIWTRIGDIPARLRAGVGIEGQGEIPLEAIRAATKSAGFLNAVDQLARKTNDKLGIFSIASMEFEKLSSAQAYTSGFLKAWSHLWKRGTGYDNMPANLERALAAIDPALPQAVYDSLRNSLNWKEVQDGLWSGVTRRQAGSFVDEIAPKYGMDPNQAREILDNTGILTRLNERLQGDYTNGAVDEAFSNLFREVEDVLDQRVKDEIVWEADRAKTLVQAEGAQAGFRLFDQMNLDYTETAFNHWVRMHQAAQEAADMMDLIGSTGGVWDKAFKQEQRAYERMNNRNKARLAGIMEAFGLNSKTSREILDREIGIQKGWEKFYNDRDAIYAEYRAGKMEWDDVQTKLMELYDATHKANETISDELDMLIVGLFQNQYGNSIGEAADTWRKGQKTIRTGMHDDMVKHRTQGAESWATFLNSGYLEQIVKKHDDNIQRAMEIYQAVLGQVAPETSPAPTKPIIPEITDWKEGGSDISAGRAAQQARSEAAGEAMTLSQRAGEVRRVASEDYNFPTTKPDGSPDPGADHHLLAIMNYDRRRAGEPLFESLAEVEPDYARQMLDNWKTRREEKAAAKDRDLPPPPAQDKILNEVGTRAGTMEDWAEGIHPDAQKVLDSLEAGDANTALRYAVAITDAQRESIRALIPIEHQYKVDAAWRTVDDLRNLKFQELRPGLREAIQRIAADLGAEIEAAETGLKVVNKKTGERTYSAGSTYPDWYRDLGKSHQYYKEGKKLTGKFAVQAALADVSEGNYSKLTALVKKIGNLLASEVMKTDEFDAAIGIDLPTTKVADFISANRNMIDLAGADMLGTMLDDTNTEMVRLIEWYEEQGTTPPQNLLDDLADMSERIYKRFDEMAEIDRIETEQAPVRAEIEQIERLHAAQEEYNRVVNSPLQITKGRMKDTLHKAAQEYFGATKEQADAWINIIDARAKVWSEDTGRPAEEYYDTHFSGVINAGELDLGDLSQGAGGVWDPVALREYRQEYTRPDRYHDWIDKAKEHFGTTEDPMQAGYILPDGDMLDFSGNKFGAGGGRNRYMDHSEISFVMIDEWDNLDIDYEGWTAVPEFTTQTGSVRVSRWKDVLFIDIGSPINNTQIRRLKDMLTDYQHGQAAEIIWDIRARDGGAIDKGTIAVPMDYDIERLANHAKEIYEGDGMPTLYQYGQGRLDLDIYDYGSPQALAAAEARRSAVGRQIAQELARQGVDPDGIERRLIVLDDAAQTSPEKFGAIGEQSQRTAQIVDQILAGTDATRNDKLNLIPVVGEYIETYRTNKQRANVRFGGILYQQDYRQLGFDDINVRAPIWRSIQREAILGIPQETMTVAQAAAAIKKAGVKADELYWSGMDEFFNSLDPNQKITKEMLLHIHDNTPVKLTEEILGAGKNWQKWYDSGTHKALGPYDYSSPSHVPITEVRGKEYFRLHEAFQTEDNTWRIEVYNDVRPFDVLPNPDDVSTHARRERKILVFKNTDGWHGWDWWNEKLFPNDVRPTFIDEGYLGVNLGDVMRALDDRRKPTKFARWTEPGGDPGSYKELLLKWDGVPKELLDNMDIVNDHWQDKTTIAHARYDTRWTPDGKKILFVEEIQSDWHQAGRDFGYVKKSDLVEMKRLERELIHAEEEYNQYLGSLWDKHFPYPEDPDIVYKKHGYGELMEILLTQEDPRDFETLNLLRDKKSEAWFNHQHAREIAKGVAEAPWSKTWPQLLMRRLARWAVDNDFDGIAWATGSQNAARYNLAQHVDGIIVTKLAGGDYNVLGYKGDHPEVKPDFGAVFSPEWTAQREMIVEKTLKDSELNANLGKELADKARAQDEHKHGLYTGTDLEVGGHGMRTFYDQMLPSLVDKDLKKYGIKTGEHVIEMGTATMDNMSVRKWAPWYDEESGTWMIRNTYHGEANASYLNDDVQWSTPLRFSTEAEAQWALDYRLKGHEKHQGFMLSPEIKAEARTKGLPLFQDRQTKATTFRNRLEEYGFVPVQAIAGILGSKKAPEYLQGITQFILAQRQKLISGQITKRDVAKALLMTTASQHAGEIKLSTARASMASKGLDFDIPKEFILHLRGDEYIRPEDLMGAWLLSPDGRAALDALDTPGADLPTIFAGAIETRKVFGNDQLNQMNLFGQPVKNKYNLTNLDEATDLINSLGSQIGQGIKAKDEFATVIRRLNGIGIGKEGFVKHLLGFGESATLDTVEINVWLTGQADTRHLPGGGLVDILREIRARENATALQSKNLGGWLLDNVEERFAELRQMGYGADIPEAAFNHVMHHWLWDQAKNTITDHDAMYKAMKYAQEIAGQVKPKGGVSFQQDGKAILYALSQPDVSTLIHETGHIFRRDLAGPDAKIAADWAGAEWDEALKDYHWNTKAEEKFARGFERYMADGQAPTPGLAGVFQKFKKWLTTIYTRIVGSDIDVNISPEMRGVFDRLLATEAQLKARAGTQAELPGAGFSETFGLRMQKGEESIFRPAEGQQPVMPGMEEARRPQMKGAIQAEPLREPIMGGRRPITAEDIAAARAKRKARTLVQGDVYADNRLPKVEKGIDKRGELIYGYPYAPDLFLKSDASGMPIRHYVTLDNGAIVHPDELDLVRVLPDGTVQLDLGTFKNRVTTKGKPGKWKTFKSFGAALADASYYMTDDPDFTITIKAENGIEVTAPANIWGDLGPKNLRHKARGRAVADLEFMEFIGKYEERLKDFIRYPDQESHVEPGTGQLFQRPGAWFDTDNGPRRILYQDDQGPVVQRDTGDVERPRIDDPDPEAMGVRPGSVEENDPAPIGQIESDVWNNKIFPMLADIQKQMKDPKTREGRSIKGLDLDPDTLYELNDYLGKQRGHMIDTKNAAITWGESQRDAALLNYSRRYGIDDYLQLIFPYQFWYTRSAIQWAMRAIDKPGIFAQYARMRHINNDNLQTEGYPSRLRDKTFIPVPFLPKWAGGGVYIDPLHQIFPFENIARPYDTWVQQKNQEQKKTEYNIMKMLADETITEDQAREALSTHTGQAWETALAQARVEIDYEIANPFDLLATMSGPSLPISIGYNMLRGREDKIGLLPLTRLIQSLTAWTTPGGINIEAPIRRAAGLPERGGYFDYYVDRELANMAATAEITTDQAKLAMVERSGQAYEMALSRVGKVQAAKNIGSFLWLDLFPEGEQRQRELQIQFSDAMDSGDPQAIRKFFDENPEYQARMLQMDWDDPDARLRNFLKSNVWESWNNLPDLWKRQAKDQLGEQFVTDFLTKTTRNYDNIDTATLAQWARVMGGYAGPATADLQGPPVKLGTDQARELELAGPEIAAQYEQFQAMRDNLFPNVNTIYNYLYALPEGPDRETFRDLYPELQQYQMFKDKFMLEHPATIEYLIGDENKLKGVDPAIQKLVLEFRVARVEVFGENIFDIQSGYFDLPKGSKARKAYLNQYPQLADYWDWRRKVLEEYPEIVPYVTSAGAKESITDMAKDIAKDMQYDPAPTISQRWFSPPLVQKLQGYYYSNEKLGSGAKTELRRIWNRTGRPGGSFWNFVNTVVRVSLGSKDYTPGR